MNDKKSYNTTKLVLSIRVLVGAYVLYMAYGIFTSSDPKPFFVTLAAIFFVLAGGFLVVWSLLQIARGQYVGGKADAGAIEEGTADLIEEDGTTEQVEADIVDIPNAREQAIDFNSATTIETVEESEITELD